MIGILKTDGGPHSADKWAEATASHIVSIADHVSGEKRGSAIKLQAAIIDILEGHHATVQDGEQTKIAEVGHDRINAPLDAFDHLNLDTAVSQIIAAAQGTPWEADFNFAGQPEIAPTEFSEGQLFIASTADHLKALLASHFATSMQVERSWHADRNPDTEQAKQFRATFHSGVTV